jgi:hypothetical protein
MMIMMMFEASETSQSAGTSVPALWDASGASYGRLPLGGVICKGKVSSEHPRRDTNPRYLKIQTE